MRWRSLLVAMVVLGLVIGCLVWLAETKRLDVKGAAVQRRGADASRQIQPEVASEDELARLLGKLQRNAALAADFEELRRVLFANPRAGIDRIVRFLATGADAFTGLPLEVGPTGKLTSSPTLRVFLLDLLGQLTRPLGGSEGAVLGRQILEKKESPEEWALALRNVAWAEPNARAYLAAKAHELLSYAPWRATAPAGFLEAFDAAVYTGDPTLIPQFAELVRNGNNVARRAAMVALDRLAEASPLAVMNFLNAHPAEIADRPLVRADFFAKANLGSEAQRLAVEAYLARTDTQSAEKEKFLAALSSPGSFVSPGLLSTEPLPDDPRGRFESIQKTTAEWLRTGQFPALRAQITRLHDRVAAGLH